MRLRSRPTGRKRVEFSLLFLCPQRELGEMWLDCTLLLQTRKLYSNENARIAWLELRFFFTKAIFFLVFVFMQGEFSIIHITKDFPHKF